MFWIIKQINHSYWNDTVVKIQKLLNILSVSLLCKNVVFKPNVLIIWAAMWGNVPSDMCTERRLKLDFAPAQSVQSLHCLHEETLNSWLSKKRPVKILIRLRECAGCSESSLDAHTKVRFLTLRIIIMMSNDKFRKNPRFIPYLP